MDFLLQPDGKYDEGKAHVGVFENYKIDFTDIF